MTSAFKRHDNDVDVYLPTCWAGQQIDGAILADSFYYLTNDDNHKIFYMNDLPTQLWKDLNLVFMTVGYSAAKIARAKASDINFAELTQYLPDYKLKTIVTISCGSELLRHGAYGFHIPDGTPLLSKCYLISYGNWIQEKANTSHVVQGGSAELWGCREWMTKEQADLYDQHIAYLIDNAAPTMSISNGTEHLKGIRSMRRVGGIHVSSWRQVFAACEAWVQQAMHSKSKLLVATYDTRPQQANTPRSNL